MNIHELQQRHSEAMTHAKRITERLQATATAEGRALGPGEQQAIDAALADFRRVDAQLARAQGEQSMMSAINAKLGLPSRGGNGHSISSRPGDSWGVQFTASDAFRQILEMGTRRPRQWSMPAVPLEMHGETLTSEGGSPGSGGDLIVPDYRPGILPSPTRRLCAHVHQPSSGLSSPSAALNGCERSRVPVWEPVSVSKPPPITRVPGSEQIVVRCATPPEGSGTVPR